MIIEKSIVKYRKELEWHTGFETLLNAISHIWVLFTIKQSDTGPEIANFTKVYKLHIRNTGGHILEENITEEIMLGWIKDQIDNDGSIEYASILIEASDIEEGHNTIVNMP